MKDSAKGVKFFNKKVISIEKRLNIIEDRLGIKEEKVIKQEIKQTKNKGNFETNIGLKWLGSIGILALVIGIGYFLKYAFENNWINHLNRIILGVIVGFILILVGETISKKEKYINWGKTLVGGGIAITYFAIYAAYHFEEYRNIIGISQILDIILLSIVVLFAVILSIKDNSKIIASEAFSLGYITSLMSGNFEFLTLAYISILAIGLIIISTYKNWPTMNIFNISATYIIYTYWYISNQNQFILASVFLIAYFLLYNAQLFFSKENDKFSIINSILNSLFFYILYYNVLKVNQPNYDALFTLSMVIFSIIFYFLVLNRNKLSTTNLGLGIFYLTILIPIQFDKEWITIFWALEVILLIILSDLFNKPTLRYGSYVVSGLLISKILLIDSVLLEEFKMTQFLESSRLFAFLSGIILFYFLSWHMKNRDYKKEQIVPIIYSWFGTSLMGLLILLEMENYWVSVGWAVLAIVTLIVGFAANNKYLRLQGIILFGITIIRVFLYDTRELEPIYKTISFIVLGLILLLASFIYAKYKDRIKGAL